LETGITELDRPFENGSVVRPRNPSHLSVRTTFPETPRPPSLLLEAEKASTSRSVPSLPFPLKIPITNFFHLQDSKQGMDQPRSVFQLVLVRVMNEGLEGRGDQNRPVTPVGFDR
jgi:hypothetical protein